MFSRPRGRTRGPRETEAAIDYLKRSAACPGKLRHSHTPLPPPRSPARRHPPRGRDEGSASRRLNNATPQTRRHEHTHPHTHTHLSCPILPRPSLNIFCPESKCRRFLFLARDTDTRVRRGNIDQGPSSLTRTPTDGVNACRRA